VTFNLRHAPPMLLLMAASPVYCQSALPSAQVSYPTKPIRVLVPFSAGSVTDILARMIGPKLFEVWGQQVVVDNRPSAGGTVAGGIVAGAAPDGYTLLLHSSGFAGSAALFDKLPYDSVKDFTGIMQIAGTPLVIVVAPSLGVNSLKDLIALAKQRPRLLNFASSGIGSGVHYATELFNLTAGISTVHVPYKGVPESLNDTLSGRTHFYIGPTVAAVPLIKSGRLLALAATSRQRIALLPDVPTAAEAGLPAYEYNGWYGILAPAKIPRSVAGKLQAEVGRILESPEVRDRIVTLGGAVIVTSSEAFEKLIRDEIVTRRKVFAAAGTKPN
jgi:tripartite-type tricarboxylate transporter receptor subunit TctC